VKILVVLTNILDVVHINRHVFTKMFQRLELFSILLPEDDDISSF